MDPESLAKEFNKLTKKQGDLRSELNKASKALDTLQKLNKEEILMFFSNMREALTQARGDEELIATNKHILKSIKYYLNQIKKPFIKFFSATDKTKLDKSYVETLQKLWRNFGTYYLNPKMEKIDLVPFMQFQTKILEDIGKQKKKTTQSLDDIRKSIEKMLLSIHESSSLQATLRKTTIEQRGLERKLKGITTKNKTIIGIIIAFIAGAILTKALGLAGIAFAGFSVAIVLANKKAKRLEAIEEKYPGILTLQQGHVLAEFKKLYGDPKMQGIIKSALLRAALSKIVDETLKKYPSLVAALGGTKKATKDFKKYAKRKWEETTFKNALDAGVGKFIARKIKEGRLGITRSKLRSLEKKLVSKIKKAQLDVTQLKTALDSVAQSYIQQANAILEDLANRLIEAIEAGKIDLQTEPVIKLT